MSAGQTFLVVGVVTAVLVVWFLVAVWVATIFGRAMRDQRRREQEDENAHGPQRRRLEFPTGAP